jgi:hypothetical protein
MLRCGSYYAAPKGRKENKYNRRGRRERREKLMEFFHAPKVRLFICESASKYLMLLHYRQLIVPKFFCGIILKYILSE